MQSLQERIGYVFKSQELLASALTHPSLNGANNQRLEFLGDAVLGALVAELLYVEYPDEAEGDLARRQSGLVRGSTLAAVARDIGLGEYLKMAAGEAQGGGRDNPTNLEDALEALVGAMYLDGGMEAARSFVVPRFTTLAKTAQEVPKDAKTALQEWVQAKGLKLPVYKVIHTEGSAHAPVFTIQVSVEGYEPLQAQATSKRAAEQLAAHAMLAQLEGST
ncbi:MAG: ribonuclease III [Alphaproteobacteria bacterium]